MTTLQGMQEECGELYRKIRDAANVQHRTHRDIVDATGLPRSFVAKFLSGAAVNPNVFYVAALCKYLGLSVDELFGLREETGDDTDAQAKIDGAAKQIELLKERSRILEAGIRERKPIIYGLAGMCIFLLVVFVMYLFLDVSDEEHGLIRGAEISPVLFVLLIAIVATVLFTAREIAVKRAKARRDEEQK